MNAAICNCVQKFFNTKVPALWHVSNITHQTLSDYLQLWESKKLRLRLTGRKDLLTVHNFTTFIHLLTNRAKGLLLKTFLAAGAWQHTEADSGLCACSIPQLLQAINHWCQHPTHYETGNWPAILLLVLQRLAPTGVAYDTTAKQNVTQRDCPTAWMAVLMHLVIWRESWGSHCGAASPHETDL